MGWINKLFETILNSLVMECEETQCECGGVLEPAFYDKEQDKVVWKCKECGKQYIEVDNG